MLVLFSKGTESFTNVLATAVVSQEDIGVEYFIKTGDFFRF